MADDEKTARSSSSPTVGRSKSRSPKGKRREVEQIGGMVPPRASRSNLGGSMPEMRSPVASSSTSSRPVPISRAGSTTPPNRGVRRTMGSPSRRTRQNDEDAEEELSQEDDLLAILDNPQDLKFFRAFLKLEFIEELLDFYLEVDEWREQWLRYREKKKSSKLRRARFAAVHLFTEFLQDDSPKLINIPSEERCVFSRVFEPMRGILEPNHNAPAGAGDSLGFATPPRAIKVPKSCPELDLLDLSSSSFDKVQCTTFNMLLEPYSRFIEAPAFRRLQTDRLKRPIKQIQISRRQLLKAHRPVSFDDVTTDNDIFNAFHGILTKEYSEDYLSFWTKLSNFALCKASELHPLASEIFEQFVVQERVYVPSDASEAIQHQIQSRRVDRHCFDLVRSEVEAILKTKFSDNISTINAEVTKLRKHKTS